MTLPRVRRARLAPLRPLRIGTHNVGGLSDPSVNPKLRACFVTWLHHRLDIVCVQELHHQRFDDRSRFERRLHDLARQFHVPGWDVVEYRFASNSDPCAGIAILVRRDLLSSGVLEPAESLALGSSSPPPAPPPPSPSVSPSPPSSPPLPLTPASSSSSLASPPAAVHPATPGAAPPPPSTRLATFSFRWLGHRLHLTCVYLPAKGASARAAFIGQHLAPVLCSPSPGDHILAGDFNFLPSVLDGTAGAARVRRDRCASHALAACAPTLVDIHRFLHPTSTDYTHMYPHGGSRLDRVYVSAALKPFVCLSAVAMDSPSDHRLPYVLLSPRAPAQRGPGMPRVRIGFTTDPALRASMDTWLQSELAHMPGPEPAHDAAVLAWWSAFKPRLARAANALSRTAHLRRLSHSAAVTSARDDLRAAEQLLAGSDPQPALPRLVAAQAALSAALRQDAARACVKERLAWVRSGEHPNPSLTQLVRPPASASAIPALRDAAGRLVVAPSCLPDIVAQFWARIGAPSPDLSPAARTAVLAAVQSQGPRFPAAATASLGDPVVSDIEVAAALKRTPPGKSPGWDGIPADLYKTFLDHFSGVLARVYTAIGRLQQLPRDFLRGVITVLYKGRGDRTQPGSYRPITLLCTDYRVLAKTLANRLLPGLSEIIPFDQSAFLPGRSIGSNVRFLRTLPHLLAQQQRSAIVAFLDFAKAYDTIDRPFLFAVMDAMGVGPGFLAWVRLLLTHTCCVARVNGYISRSVEIRSGVRQGCPLAPLLYLFVAQALLAWLVSHQVGIRLNPADSASVITGCQYADDTESVLPDAAAIPPFLELMSTFAKASGQCLNHDKVELLLVGHTSPSPSSPAAAPPSSLGGLRVVPASTALGVPFTNPPDPPTLDWDTRGTEVRSRLSKVARAGLSEFGRATACSAYGLSKLLFHTENCGLPPAAFLDSCTASVARVVDRELAPTTHSKRLTGIPAHLLPGHPTAGGFGLLPIVPHTYSRHAKWSITCALSELSSQPAPWLRVLRSWMQHHHPAFRPFAALTAPLAGPWLGGLTSLPPDLHRLITSFARLPPPVDIASPPLLPGSWCAMCPLWGNVYLPNAGAPDRPRGLENHHFALTHCRRLLTIRDLTRTLDALELFNQHRTATLAADPTGIAVFSTLQSAWVAFLRQHLDPDGLAYSRYQDRWQAMAELTALEHDIAPAWLAAARAATSRPGSPLPSTDAVIAMLLPRLGWRLTSTLSVTLRNYTVRYGTSLLSAGITQQRSVHQATYLREAFALLPAQPAPARALPNLQQAYARVWKRLTWEPRHKVIFWRLAIDGVPMKGNSHVGGAPDACGCGTYPGVGPVAMSPRLHHFWACPVATTLVRHLAAHLHCPVERHHLWLLTSPDSRRVQPCVWDVVALSALNALELVRRNLRAWRQVGPGVLRRACILVRSRFESFLRDFVSLGLPARGWNKVSFSHPFIGVQGDHLILNYFDEPLDEE